MIFRTLMLLSASTVILLSAPIAAAPIYTNAIETEEQKKPLEEELVDQQAKASESSSHHARKGHHGPQGATGQTGATGATGANADLNQPFAEYAVDDLAETIIQGPQHHDSPGVFGVNTAFDSDFPITTSDRVVFSKTIQKSADGAIEPSLEFPGEYLLTPGIYLVKYRVDGDLSLTVTSEDNYSEDITVDGYFDLSLSNTTNTYTPVDYTRVELDSVSSIDTMGMTGYGTPFDAWAQALVKVDNPVGVLAVYLNLTATGPTGAVDFNSQVEITNTPSDSTLIIEQVKAFD